MTVAEHNPLKQGLKHYKACLAPYQEIVAEHNPLKQGLKQANMDTLPATSSSCRA